jgi:hypothetical protein
VCRSAPEVTVFADHRGHAVFAVVPDAAGSWVRAAIAAIRHCPAVWGRPSFSNWIEGVDVAASVALADSFVLESYYPTAGEVAREIDHTPAAASLTDHGPDSLSAAITLWPSFHATRESFLSKVSAIRGSGVTKLGLYNYGTATASTLSWVADAVAVMEET